MADQINDSEEESEVENIGVEPSEAKKEVEVRRFDPEALLTDEGGERDGDDAIYVDASSCGYNSFLSTGNCNLVSKLSKN